ncbi:MAG: peptidoglycan editing factor PgeF [Cyclobacteriaceae bacterium]|nr:peptidoglycan editing factor PgeF [Cyclobacteriaceae bacterium]
MKRVTFDQLGLWQFEILSQEPAIRHFVTDRNSYSFDDTFTLSYSSTPDTAKVRVNRQLLASAMQVDEHHLVFPSQVHQTNIVHVTAGTTKDDVQETDALITFEKNLCIAVMSADCVPIILYDKKNMVVAAVHSGWRGTVARILEKTLHEMHMKFGTVGSDLLAGIGPSVSQDAYEVGEEVIQSVQHTFGRESDLMIHHSAGKARLDLWKANKLQLLEFSVPEGQIEIADLCTVKNNNHFFSARKGDTGRFAAGIMVL